MKSPRVLQFNVILGLAWWLAGAVSADQPKSYHGYSVVRANPRTVTNLQSLHSLERDKQLQSLQFWSRPNAVNRTVDILVGPTDQQQLAEKLKYWLLPVSKFIPNVQRVIDEQNNKTASNRLPRRATGQLRVDNKRDDKREGKRDGFFANFQSYGAIETRLKTLAKKCRQISLSVIGKSTEGRSLYLAEVSSKRANSSSKPVIFIDAGHHAREWASHSTGLYLLESLVNEKLPRKSSDLKAKLDLDNFDYWFVPVVNPDGYEYSRNKDRMWRKTRSKSPRKVSCPLNEGEPYGVDPNRNYPLHWRGEGTSSSPCEEIYTGSRALSEPETAAIAKVLRENKERIVMYITLHTYGQVILAPYGYGSVRASNFDEHRELGLKFVEAVAKLRGTRFEFGNAADLMGPGAGGSDDFAKGDVGIRFSFTIELADKGAHGFMLPPSLIVPVGQETAIGLRAMTDKLREMLKSGRGGPSSDNRKASGRVRHNKSSF